MAPAHMPSFTENVVHHIDLYGAETAGALSEIDYILTPGTREFTLEIQIG